MGLVTALRKFFGDGSEAESAQDIVRNCVTYPSVGDYLVTEITRIYSRPGEKTVRIKVDVPYGCEEWSYSRPYVWDADDNFLVSLAESRGYKQHTFDQLEGDAVLIRPSDGNTWSMKRKTPEEHIEEQLEEETVEPEDLPYDQLQHLGVDVPVDRQETVARDTPVSGGQDTIDRELEAITETAD